MSKSRKELKDNELAGAITDQFDSIKPHLPKILLGFFLIAAIVFGVNYMISSRSSAKESKAINLVLFGVENSASGSLATLDKQIEDFPEDGMTAWAHLLKGDRELTSGLEKIFVDRMAGRDFIQRSLKHFEKANQLAGDNEKIQMRALFGWARALESLGQFDDASAKFAEIVKLGESPFATLAEKGITRVNNPDNREFYVLFNERENNSLETTSTDPAPTTNSGLPARPDFTYPGEEAVTDGTPNTLDVDNGPQGKKEDDTSKKSDAPPMPSDDVLGKGKRPEPPSPDEDESESGKSEEEAKKSAAGNSEAGKSEAEAKKK